MVTKCLSTLVASGTGHLRGREGDLMSVGVETGFDPLEDGQGGEVGSDLVGVGDSKELIGEDGRREVEGMALGWEGEGERGRVVRGESCEEPGREVSRGGVGVTAS